MFVERSSLTYKVGFALLCYVNCHLMSMYIVKFLRINVHAYASGGWLALGLCTVVCSCVHRDLSQLISVGNIGSLKTALSRFVYFVRHSFQSSIYTTLSYRIFKRRRRELSYFYEVIILFLPISSHIVCTPTFYFPQVKEVRYKEATNSRLFLRQETCESRGSGNNHAGILPMPWRSHY